jgi:cell division protein FtsB
MEQVVDRVFNPAVAWVLIPLTAILCWGLINSVRAFRGTPEDAEELGQLKAEVEQLRARVEQLERAQSGFRQDAFTGRPGS